MIELTRECNWRGGSGNKIFEKERKQNLKEFTYDVG